MGMIKTGKIKNYNQERGFGFISYEEDSKNIFFHIKDFPKGILPQIGEKLTFHIAQDGQKIKAVNIVRLDFPSENTYRTTPERIVSRSRRNNKQSQDNGSDNFLGIFMLVIIVGGIGYFIYGYIQDSLQRRELAKQPVTQETLKIANAQAVNNHPNNFKCDGRTHCSQMTSKAEADWFVRNCPGTQMDGDGDGHACETQFGNR